MSARHRPPKVTAAGVLLVVVGSDVLLVSLAGVGFLIWTAVGFAFVPCVAAAIVVGWVPVSVGGLILSNGVAVLRGTAPTTRTLAAAYTALGIGTWIVLAMAVLFGACGLGRLSVRDLTPVGAGAIAFLLLNVAAVTVAGELLGRSTSEYEAWRLERASPPTDPDDGL